MPKPPLPVASEVYLYICSICSLFHIQACLMLFHVVNQSFFSAAILSGSELTGRGMVYWGRQRPYFINLLLIYT